jgi:MFS family permease
VSDASTEQRTNWPQLALGWLVYFSFGMVAVSLVPIITPLREELGISYTEMGVILGAWQLVYIGAAAPGGILIDRIGPKRESSASLPTGSGCSSWPPVCSAWAARSSPPACRSSSPTGLLALSAARLPASTSPAPRPAACSCWR